MKSILKLGLALGVLTFGAASIERPAQAFANCCADCGGNISACCSGTSCNATDGSGSSCSSPGSRTIVVCPAT